MPETWKAPDTSFRPGVAAAERIVGAISTRMPKDPGKDTVRARWLGGLAAGLAVSGVEGTHGLHEVALALDEHVMSVAVATPIMPPAAPAPMATVLRGGGAEMMRIGATRRFVDRAAIIGPFLHGGPAGLSGVAAGGLIGSIVRPQPIVAPAGGVVPVLTDRQRLDRFRTPQGTILGTWIERANSVTVTQLRGQMTSLVEATGVLKLALTPTRDVLTVRSDDLLTRLHPDRTVIDTMRARLNLGAVSYDAFKDSMIRPIMAAPRFDRPMYQALDQYDREWLVPGLSTLPEPELVTLLSANDQFTEAFLVGLSDEMGRELLWREYPTDSRGTYFYRFWDPNTDELRQQIHRFSSGRLGSHVSVGPPGESGRAVVVIRGEIVRRYPDMTVMALKSTGTDGEGRPLLPEAPTDSTHAAPSLFHAMLPPDIMLAGLDITVNELRQPDWWIVLAEHPQATRFRRAEPDLAGHEVRFASPVKHGIDATGAIVAAERLENPTRIAFAANDFLPPAS
jgi:hypothetical protein